MAVKPVRRNFQPESNVNVSYEAAEKLAEQLADKTYGQPPNPLTTHVDYMAQPHGNATSNVKPTTVSTMSKEPIKNTVVRSISIAVDLDDKLEKYVFLNRLQKADKHKTKSSVINELLEDFLSKI